MSEDCLCSWCLLIFYMEIAAHLNTMTDFTQVLKEFNERLAARPVAAAAGEVHLYVLRLRSPPGEPPRYYVGSAVDYEARLAAHFSGAGAAYTRRYPPAELVELRRGDRYDEDAATRRLMSEHGIEYVRGGAYTRVVLSPEDTAVLQHEIRAAAGLCMNCGKAQHFAASCRAPAAPAPAAPAPLVPVINENNNENFNSEKCDRCGRRGHSAGECRTRVENLNCEKCHRRGHRADVCHAGQDVASPKSYTCFCCGYRGHTSNHCIAKYDIEGELIQARNKFLPPGYVYGSAAAAAPTARAQPARAQPAAAARSWFSRNGYGELSVSSSDDDAAP